MPNIDIEIWDMTGNKRLILEIPDDIVVGEMMKVLARRMHLPEKGPDSAPLAYKFHHKPSGRQLKETETLQCAGVCHGDVLRMVPEIDAG